MVVAFRPSDFKTQLYMWYNADFNKWAVQLLPPILRSRALVALLKAMIQPLVYLHYQFILYRLTSSGRLDVTASVQDIERVLNSAFFLNDGQIYLESMNSAHNTFLYFQKENMPSVFVDASFRLYMPDEVPDTPNFIIYIPTFLCTALDKEKDLYKGRYLTTIINLLNFYKPAGRRFGIKLYEYE